MADVGQMNANLVRPPCVQRQLNKSKSVAFFQHPVIGDRRPAARDAAGHFLAIVFAAADDRFNAPARPLDFSAADSAINLLNGSRFELGNKRLMRGVGLGDDDAAAGAFVESMNDAGPFDATNSSKLSPAVVEQRVDQGVLAVASGGMCDET